MTVTPERRTREPGLRALTALAVVLLSAACTPSPAPQADERLLIDGGTVVVMDDPGTVLEGGAVLVEGERIAGLLAPGDPRPSDVAVLDATGHLVIPGLVNTHGHAAMSLLRDSPTTCR